MIGIKDSVQNSQGYEEGFYGDALREKGARKKFSRSQGEKMKVRLVEKANYWRWLLSGNRCDERSYSLMEHVTSAECRPVTQI